MKVLLFFFVSALLSAVNSIPACSQTTYLLIKSEVKAKHLGVGVSIHSVPMTSPEQCEEAGAVIFASSRFDTRNATRDGFECIEGK